MKNLEDVKKGDLIKVVKELNFRFGLYPQIDINQDKYSLISDIREAFRLRMAADKFPEEIENILTILKGKEDEYVD